MVHAGSRVRPPPGRRLKDHDRRRNPDGTPCAHPVYARGPRIRGAPYGGRGHFRYNPPGWTWVKQIPVRPFLAEAVDAKQDEMVRIFAGVIDDWMKDKGYK